MDVNDSPSNAPTIFWDLPPSRKYVHQTYDKFTIDGNKTTVTRLQEY